MKVKLKMILWMLLMNLTLNTQSAYSTTFEQCEDYYYAGGPVKLHSLLMRVQAKKMTSDDQSLVWQLLKSQCLKAISLDQNYHWGDFFPQNKTTRFELINLCPSDDSTGVVIKELSLISGVQIQCFYQNFDI